MLKSMNPLIAWNAQIYFRLPKRHRSLIFIGFPDNRKSTQLASSSNQNSLTGAPKEPLFSGRESPTKNSITHLYSRIHHTHRFLHYFPAKIGKSNKNTIISIISIHMHNLIQNTKSFAFLYIHPKYPQQSHTYLYRIHLSMHGTSIQSGTSYQKT